MKRILSLILSVFISVILYSQTTYITIPNVSGAGMIYPAGAGIVYYNGTSWGSSYTSTGSGSVIALATSPVFVNPSLGVATATSLNKLTLTQPATSATLTLVQGSTLATSGAYSTTLTATGTTNVTLPTSGTLATVAGTETFTNKTLTSPAINTPKLAIGIPSASLDGNGTIISGTAGETLAFGDMVYIKSDGKFWKGLGTSASTTPIVGMAMGAITASNTGNILITGIIRNDSWSLTVGGAIYLSVSTGGGMTQTQPSTAGQFVQIIGYALSATNILFNPNSIVIGL